MAREDGLNWDHKVAEIRERREFTRGASDAECAVVSEIFGDATCKALTAAYTITPLAPGRYRVAGRTAARLEQTCGVTLDPVEQDIEEAFDVEFQSGARRGLELEPDFDALSEDEPEPIEHGRIRMGRFICEIVASAIDPFARAPDAELERTEAYGSSGAANPFAALAKLKDDAENS